MAKYNGWTNRETWNVMLWLNNIESLYFSMIALFKENDITPSYRELIQFLDLSNEMTDDRVLYISDLLNYNELNEAIENLYNEYKLSVKTTR